MLIHLKTKPVVDDGYEPVHSYNATWLVTVDDPDERSVATQLVEISQENNCWTAVELNSLINYLMLNLMQDRVGYEHSAEELSWRCRLTTYLWFLFTSRFLENMIVDYFMSALLRLADRKKVEFREEDDGMTYVYPLPNLAKSWPYR